MNKRKLGRKDVKSLLRISIVIFLNLLLTVFANSQEKLKTPNSEVEDSIKYLVGEKEGIPYVSPIDAPYIRFLSTYSIPKYDDRRNAVLTTSFILHSLVGPSKNFNSNNAGAFYPLARIEDEKFVEH